MQNYLRHIAAAALAIQVAAMPVRAEEWRYDGVDRIVAMSDVHGAYDAMVAALQAAEVIDADLAWSADTTHLVIIGDLLDRGANSRDVMDLLMQLESEAASAGGKVHVLIGNHEAMNLMGDLRYVAKGEYGAFQLDETADERERWFEAWAAARAPADLNDEGRRVTFRQQFPAGYFAHRREFASDGAYGRWLLSKPIIVVINGTAFVHGGLSPMIGEIGLDGVNGKLRQEMVRYVEQVGVLQEAGVLLPTDGIHEHETILAAYLPPPDAEPEVLQAVESVQQLAESDLHALNGPLWYRGNIVCGELIEADKLARVFDVIGAHRVVVGHTPTPGRQVLERFDGRLIEIDTGMLNAYYGGSGHALIIDKTGVSVVNQDAKTTTPLPHPRNVGTRPAGKLSAGQLETLLSAGEVVARRKDETGRIVFSISDGAHTIDATFSKRPRRGFYPEVAAYRLDRLLELDMVPVTVKRKIDGDDGSLQFLPKNSINEIQRQEEGGGGGAWCPLPEQWDAMSVFDALIYNEARSAINIRYNVDMWQVMLTQHRRAFSTSDGVPPRLQSVPLKVSQAWHDKLAEFSEASLTEGFADVLDRRRIRALATRAAALAARSE